MILRILMNSILGEILSWNIGLKLAVEAGYRRSVQHISTLNVTPGLKHSVIVHTHSRVLVLGILYADMSMLWRWISDQ